MKLATITCLLACVLSATASALPEAAGKEHHDMAKGKHHDMSKDKHHDMSKDKHHDMSKGKHHGMSKDMHQCDPKVVSLATGIHLNIEGQHAELMGAKKIQKIESAKKVSEQEFLMAKGELLSDIAAGMTIRKYNQAIAPKGNAANPGLAKYAKAQGTEQKLAMSLTGMPEHDKKTLEMLVGDIKNGTMLNMMNLKKATEGCSLGFTFPA